MRYRSLCRCVLVPAVALLAALLFSASAAASAGHRQVGIRDDCDPVSFNAAVGPDTCVGDGETVFDDFIAQLVDHGSADKWRFKRDHFGLNSGGSVTAVNEGGEFHTFTEVAAFGGGCIPFLNGLLGLSSVPECLPEVAPGVPLAFATTGVPPGGTLTIDDLSPGTHRFQCLIHPWMHSVAVVRADD